MNRIKTWVKRHETIHRFIHATYCRAMRYRVGMATMGPVATSTTTSTTTTTSNPNQITITSREGPRDARVYSNPRIPAGFLPANSKGTLFYSPADLQFEDARGGVPLNATDFNGLAAGWMLHGVIRLVISDTLFNKIDEWQGIHQVVYQW